MNIILVIIAITAIFSYRGFTDVQTFEKYKFNVAAIAQRKEYVRLISAGFLHVQKMKNR